MCLVELTPFCFMLQTCVALSVDSFSSELNPNTAMLRLLPPRFCTRLLNCPCFDCCRLLCRLFYCYLSSKKKPMIFFVQTARRPVPQPSINSVQRGKRWHLTTVCLYFILERFSNHVSFGVFAALMGNHSSRGWRFRSCHFIFSEFILNVFLMVEILCTETWLKY